MLPWLDLLKLAATLGSMATIYHFRKSIMKIVADLIVGANTADYQDMPISELLDNIDSKLEGLLND